MPIAPPCSAHDGDSFQLIGGRSPGQSYLRRLAGAGWIWAALVWLPAAALEFAPPATKPDLLTGKDINGVCAGCHGDDGQGGKDGAYPRIAGLPLAYIYQQVKLFQQNVRPNLAMLEHVHERQLSDQEILDIAAYLSGIKLATRLTPMDEKDPKFNAYERMIELKRIVQIPAYAGDVAAGRKRYAKECRSCHGADGWGDPDDGVPQLAGQYTQYLWRQIDKYRNGVRIHDPEAPEDDILADFTREELGDILAYLSLVDD
jgi:cytochrome c553